MAQGNSFNIRVSFSDDEASIRFRPDEFRVTEALVTNAVQGALALLSSLPRLSHTRSFVPFYEGTPSGTRLSDVVRLVPCLQCSGLSPILQVQPLKLAA